MNNTAGYIVVCGKTGDIKYFTDSRPTDCSSVWDVPSDSTDDYWTFGSVEGLSVEVRQ